jgi:hypothetical protein
MVLISHRYKFIYIKNIKVAGTSVESFFEKYCINPNIEYVKTQRINTKISKYGLIGFRGIESDKKKFKNTLGFTNHMGCKGLKNKIPPKIYNNYIKFCVIRNPYDKMVSKYFFSKSELSFKEFCKKAKCVNINRYTINGKNQCNILIRFENLKEDIIKICKILGIKDYDIDNDLPNYKSQNRNEKKHYSYYYDEETKNIVYNKHKSEFIRYKYKFEDKTNN